MVFGMGVERMASDWESRSGFPILDSRLQMSGMTEGMPAGMTEGRAWPAVGSFGRLAGEWTALRRLVKPEPHQLR